jgi:hypothetical protein
MTTNHKCSDWQPFRNRIVILDGKDEKMSEINERVYFFDDGRIGSKGQNEVVDRTPDYLPFIYELTNGNPQFIIDQHLLETRYSELMCQLKNGLFALNPFENNYTMPHPDRSRPEFEYDEPIPMDLVDNFL